MRTEKNNAALGKVISTSHCRTSAEVREMGLDGMTCTPFLHNTTPCFWGGFCFFQHGAVAMTVSLGACQHLAKQHVSLSLVFKQADCAPQIKFGIPFLKGHPFGAPKP